MRNPFASDLDPIIALGVPLKIVFDILVLGLVFRRSGMEWFWIVIPW